MRIGPERLSRSRNFGSAPTFEILHEQVERPTNDRSRIAIRYRMTKKVPRTLKSGVGVSGQCDAKEVPVAR